MYGRFLYNRKLLCNVPITYKRSAVHKTGCIRHMASAIIRDIRIAEVQIRTAVRIDQLNERENTI